MSSNEADIVKNETSASPQTQLSLVDLYLGGSAPAKTLDYARADIDDRAPKQAAPAPVGFYHVDAGSQYLDPAARFQVDPRGQYRVAQPERRSVPTLPTEQRVAQVPAVQPVEQRVAQVPATPPVVPKAAEPPRIAPPAAVPHPFQQPTILDQYLAPKQPAPADRTNPAPAVAPGNPGPDSGLDPAAQREAENRRKIMEARNEMKGVRERLAKEAEQRRKNEIEEAKKYVPNPLTPPAPVGPTPGGRARFGVPSDLGRTLDGKNQQDRRDIDRIEEGARPLAPQAPTGRARYGVDPGTGRVLSDREQELRRNVDKKEEQLRPADTTPRPPMPTTPFQPRPLPTDGTQWKAPSGNSRTFEDKLDFDKDGKQVGKSVGDYLNKYGPAQKPRAPGAPGASSNPLEKPNPLSVDGQLRRFGDWVRGK